MAAKRTIICGSPRSMGVSAQVVDYLRERLEQMHPEDGVSILRMSDLHIAPCIGCNQCRDTGRCFMHDDMDSVMDALAAADELFVVSPVYFAGPPAQFKALLDRLQPHFWMNTRADAKRPASLFAVGEGHDPHGFEPLAVRVRSALAVAGFKLLDVHDCVDKSAHAAVDSAFAQIDAAASQPTLDTLSDGGADR